MSNTNIIWYVVRALLIGVGLFGLCGSPLFLLYYNSIVLDPSCLEEAAQSYCNANNLSFVSVWDAESFYCKGDYNERISPEGIRIAYHFTDEEQLVCKVKEAKSWREFK